MILLIFEILLFSFVELFPIELVFISAFKLLAVDLVRFKLDSLAFWEALLLQWWRWILSGKARSYLAHFFCLINLIELQR